MESFTHRHFRDASDIRALKRVAGASFARVPSHPFGGIEWVVFGPPGFPPSEIVEIWEDSHGEPVAWAILSSTDGFEYRIVPALEGSPLEEEVFGWVVHGIVAWRKANGFDARCVVGCWRGDDSRAALLGRHGYREGHVTGVLFRQRLGRAVAAPAPPADWTVRGLAADDIDSRAHTQFEAFSPGSKTTPAKWRYLMQSAPGYDPDLDSVAVNAQGTVASAALAWLDEDRRVGEFEPVGTRPELQRMGLGRAVLLRGLAKMQERGMESAIVGTNATNVAAIALYRSVGFEIVNRVVSYESAL